MGLFDKARDAVTNNQDKAQGAVKDRTGNL